MKRVFVALIVFQFVHITVAENSIKAVYDLIERITPGYSSQYKLELISANDEKDVYEIDSSDGEIVLRGNNGVALASAFNWYLKYTCNAHISWFGDQLNLPNNLPLPKKERRVIQGKYRVYMNYCTLSYSAAWWDWERWQREIDYMAMRGINMPLATVGLSAVWYNTLLRFNYTDEEARAFLTFPGHSAWQWMQNIQNEDVPLPKSVMDKQVALGKQIMNRLLELDMQPIQQGFSGYVPRNFKEKFPHAVIHMKKGWCGYPSTAQLDPTDPLFKRFGAAFLEEEKKLFGAHGHYASDPFHESYPPVTTPEYLHQVGDVIYNMFQEFHPNSIWMMQSWSIQEHIAKAVPKKHLVILDLDGARKRGGRNGKIAFWGYPIVTGNLHNFGGRINMHGDLPLTVSNQYASLKKKYPNIVGQGLFMEGIEQNPLYYNLLFEMSHHQGNVNLDEWLIRYAQRRYGFKSESAYEALKCLSEGPYGRKTNGTEFSSIVAARPAVDVKKSGPNGPLNIVYDATLLYKAQRFLLEDSRKLKDSKPYRFDLIDLQRQIMSNLGQLIHKSAADAFKAKDIEAFRLHSSRFLMLMDDLDKLLCTRSEYNLYHWLNEARQWGDTAEEKNLMEKDATALVTIWGPNDHPVIFDYSWREWGGLVGEFYLPRWKKFYAMLEKHLIDGTGYVESGLPQAYKREAFRANQFYSDLADWEIQYVNTFGKVRVPISEGDEVNITKRMFKKYLKLAKEYYNSTNDGKLINNETFIENFGG